MTAISSSKSALHGMVHWLANTYAKKGITVNGIAPALIQDTKMLPGSNDELSKSTFYIQVLKCSCRRLQSCGSQNHTNNLSLEIPIGRLGTPDEIADTILWMIKTGYVTNKVIAVDGGMFPQ
jgi:3-oxoacyl-[acyl-carrier protein] reductase